MRFAAPRATPAPWDPFFNNHILVFQTKKRSLKRGPFWMTGRFPSVGN
jgi:hypothetical protein